MGYYRNLDIQMIMQSTPSLLISLLGVTLSGKKLDIDQGKLFAKKYPILLLSNCMLTFKGNAELIYTLHLSSFSQRKDLQVKKYLRFALDNACLVFAQSILIGITLGLLGFARNVVLNSADALFFARILLVCLFSALGSSFLIVCLLIPSVIAAVRIGANPDNIVLPIISAFGDFLDIVILVASIERFQNCDFKVALLGIFGILSIFPFLLIAVLHSKHRVPLQSFTVLLITYVLSTFSSYAVQFLSKSHFLLASATPIFCGLTGSISYIYLNRRITALQNNVPYNKKTTYTSLLTTALIISIITSFAMPAIGIEAKKIFNLLFALGFMLSVSILLRITEIIMLFFTDDVANAGVASVPLITSIADFVGTVIIISTSIAVYGVQAS